MDAALLGGHPAAARFGRPTARGWCRPHARQRVFTCGTVTAVIALLVFALAALSLSTQAPSSTTPGTVPIVIETALGSIDAEVDLVRAPITAANFLRYVDAGLFDQGDFHRTVRPDTESRKDYPIEVVQGRMNRARRDESFPAIMLEPTRVTGITHTDGVLSMARSGPDTATDEFFIVIGSQPTLDFGGLRNADGQGFAAFGRVTRGLDVVRRIQAAPVAPGTQTLTPPIAITRIRRVDRAPRP